MIRAMIIPGSMSLEQARKLRDVETEILMSNIGISLSSNLEIAQLQKQIFCLQEIVDKLADNGSPY